MIADGASPAAAGPVKQRRAALSVISNSCLILLKVIAGTITGSVAILTEAVHSSIDLVASVVAFFSVRKAESLPIRATATATRRSRTWLQPSRGF
jgi:divalent metal cation (Fe/Co/Zn/Cd) transporter